MQTRSTLNNDPSATQILRPTAPGVTRFRYTMTERGNHHVSVVARNAYAQSESAGGWAWWVTDAPRVTSTDFPRTGGRLGPGTFTVQPRAAVRTCALRCHSYSFGGWSTQTTCLPGRLAA